MLKLSMKPSSWPERTSISLKNKNHQEEGENEPVCKSEVIVVQMARNMIHIRCIRIQLLSALLTNAYGSSWFEYDLELVGCPTRQS